MSQIPDLDIDLLRSLCLTPGAPGSETLVRELVLDQIKDYVDHVETDPLGNLVAIKKGRNPGKVLVAAHMDEISFIITHIDPDGFAKFHTLGGFDPKTLTSQRVIVHGKEDVLGVIGSKPIHLMSPEERQKAPKLKDYFIDFGMSADRVKALVQIGDKVTRERDLVELGDCVSTKSLDNRISVFILIETLKRMATPAVDFYAVFTVQEEVGLRGATTVTRKINPDFGFGLDTTIANDLPGSSEAEYITKLGGGAAVKIMDSSVITDSRMVRFMEDVAKRNKIPTQREILTGGGTDTAAIQRSGDGAIVGCVSIPTRHIHSVVEMCHKGDIDHAISLLQHCLEELDQFSHDWA
ncbi:M42 family metallopeptidase [Pontibacter sp. G13]|uniref:M42 family metallopeptidase n=1 Tax=Pontibacter sp. G13 TaxID=3074898 RepID=UPI00288AE1A6|nr:M42 family metallopeptidase [Pontibacter sp. G13]WNJ16232.1 M42 family metallopeptidase [Pontibacter sp. G13]